MVNTSLIISVLVIPTLQYVGKVCFTVTKPLILAKTLRSCQKAGCYQFI